MSLRKAGYDLGRLMLKLLFWSFVGIVFFFALYYALASPPMHLVYDVAPPAGPSTIYVPGKQLEDDGHLFSYLWSTSFLIECFFIRWWILWILVSSRLSSVHRES